MRDSCGICSVYQTEEEDEALDRSTIVAHKSPTRGNTKLDSIVEMNQEETVDDEEEGEENETANNNINLICGSATFLEEKKDDDEVKERTDDDDSYKETDDEIRSPASCDFTKIFAAAFDDTESTRREERPQRNFDENPTPLYLTLMRKDWSGTILRCGEAPEEVSIWIYRQEESGKLRWKLLPIHASIIFGAPVAVLNNLLETDASTAMAPDDQGMIPLHLAVRMGCPANIIRALVLAAPTSTAARDRKGRTPRDLALRQSGTVRERLLAALDVIVPEEPKNVVAVVAATKEDVEQLMVEAPVVEEAGAAPVVQERAVPPTQSSSPPPPAQPVQQQQQQHVVAVAPPKPDPALVARVHLVGLQLERSEASNKEFQSQLEALITKEKRLRFEHQELQDTYAAATNTYVEAETANKAVISNLVNQVGDLQNKVTSIACEKTELQAELAYLKEQMDVERGDYKLKILDLERDLGNTQLCLKDAEESVERLETENAQAKVTLASHASEIIKLRETIAEQGMKLEEVTLSEQELAWKNSSLHETIKNLPDPVSLDRQIDGLESEKKELKSTVHKLSVKLYKVVGFLDEMVQEQDAIIAESLSNGGGLLNDDASAALDSTGGGSDNDERQKLLTNVSGLKEQIGAIIESVLGNMPARSANEADEEDETE